MNSLILTRTKCLGLVRVAAFLGLLQLISLMPSAMGHNCDKYCFESCGQYFPGSEFSTCVDANVYCTCVTEKFSIRNPLVIFFVVFSIMASCCLIAVCYRYHNRGRTFRGRVIAEPIVSTIPVSHGRVGNYDSSPSRGYSNIVVAAPVISSPQSQIRHDVPPEYSAPPPYNDCVIDVKPEKT